MTIVKIINNKIHKSLPNNIWHLVLIFAILTFILGFVCAWTLNKWIVYNQLYMIIYNNGTLIFDDKYYKIVEITYINRII